MVARCIRPTPSFASARNVRHPRPDGWSEAGAGTLPPESISKKLLIGDMSQEVLRLRGYSKRPPGLVVQFQGLTTAARVRGRLAGGAIREGPISVAVIGDDLVEAVEDWIATPHVEFSCEMGRRP